MFYVEITFPAGNNYPDLHHSQRGMKFATQISTLLNFIYLIVSYTRELQILSGGCTFLLFNVYGFTFLLVRLTDGKVQPLRLAVDGSTFPPINVNGCTFLQVDAVGDRIC